MKKITLIISAFTFAISISAQNSALKIVPEKPEAGKKVTITYTGKLAKDSSTLEVYSYAKSLHITKEIPTVFTKNRLVGEFIVPDTLKYISIHVKNKNQSEKTGFGFNVYKNGKIVNESLFDEGIIRFIEKSMSIDSAVLWMEKEFKLHPKVRENRISDYIMGLTMIDSRRNEGLLLADKTFNEDIQKGKEKDLYTLVYMLSNGNKQKQDSLDNIIIKKFPTGNISLFHEISKLSSIEPDSVPYYVNKIRNTFPNISEKNKDNLVERLNTAYRMLFDYENFEKNIQLVKSNEVKASEYNEIAWKMVLKNKDLTRAKSYSESSLAILDSLLKTDKNKNENWKNEMIYRKGNYSDTYAYILSKLGNKKEAIAHQLKSVELTKNNNPDINKRLVQFLIDNSQPKEAMLQAEDFMLKQKDNVQLDSLYKVAYVMVNGNDNGFDSVFQDIMKRQKDTYLNEFKKEMVNIPAPPFSLIDLDGNTVNLSDMKGKIVILDFWATWCGPCIASFPSMQKAMNILKNSDVQFFFINTFEMMKTEKRLDAVKKTLTNEKVDFQVLLDEQKDGNSLVAKAYDVQAIPAKFVIDKEGNIRYKSLGFENEATLMKELKTIVEILNEKK